MATVKPNNIPQRYVTTLCDVSVDGTSITQNIHHKYSKTMKIRIVINVSGNIFETHESTLKRFPNTLLGNKTLRLKYYCSKSKQYYFNRNRNTFGAILFFYQSTGKLYCPKDVAINEFVAECQFFQLPETSIQFLRQVEGASLLQCVQSDHQDLRSSYASDNNLSLKKKLWNFLELPRSSSYAKFYFAIQQLFIFASITMYCLETTLPWANLEDTGNIYEFSMKNPWFLLESMFSLFFLLDISVRFSICPDKKNFMRAPLNIIDVLCVPPYIFFVTGSLPTSVKIWLKLLRFLRILRILHFGKLFRNIQTIFMVIQDCVLDLQYFSVILVVMITVGGSCLYFFEQSDEHTDFISIPQSFWWAIQAFLTLGYGDIVPKTVSGKFFSCFFMVFGMSTVMTPVLSQILKLVNINTEMIKRSGPD